MHIKQALPWMDPTVPDEVRQLTDSLRVLGESHDLTLRMRRKYAETLCKDPSATLDDLREAVTTLVETDRIARRVLGTAHPLTKGIEGDLQYARAALDARETPPPGSA